MNNKEVIDFCRLRIGKGMYPEEICEELMNNCLAPDCQMGGLGGDNMTVVLVCFLHNKPYTDLVKRCSSDGANVAVLNKSDALNESSPCKVENILLKNEEEEKEEESIFNPVDEPYILAKTKNAE